MDNPLAEALALVRSEVADRVGEAEPRTRTRAPHGIRRSGRGELADRIHPPAEDLRKYWHLYQTVPLVRAPINQFADDVVAPGYHVAADSSATREFLAEWAERAAIVGGERNRDLSELLRSIPVQHEVMGTCICEHAPAREDRGRIAGLALVDPSTITPYTRPDTSILLGPDETDYSNVKLTDAGKVAAYVQYDREAGFGDDDPSERRLSLDDASKIEHDPSPSDVFGTSSIAPVYDRVEALLDKLANNERAIESLAWGQFFIGFDPMIIQNEQGGEEIIEWDEESMDDTMDEMEEASPGDMIGHDGQLEINNIPGEVAEIMDYLQFDIDYILTSMPSPTYAVGAGVERDINQFVTDAQETRHNVRVDSMRRKIERMLSPVFRAVAEQNGFDPSGVELKLEDDPEDDAPADEAENNEDAQPADDDTEDDDADDNE